MQRREGVQFTKKHEPPTFIQMTNTVTAALLVSGNTRHRTQHPNRQGLMVRGFEIALEKDIQIRRLGQLRTGSQINV